MKKILSFLILAAFFFGCNLFQAQTTTNVFDNILFYDGYAGVVSQPVPPAVIRHRNDLYAKKIDGGTVTTYGNNVSLNISIKAACDNYDRIGNVNLALVPKGFVTYNPDMVQRIELGRFITPFMNKNVAPNLVTYTFSVDNLSKILNDADLNAAYDFWMEFEVFGVPYAANTQIAGCTGRNDVFFGSLDIVSSSTATASNPTFLLPLNFKKNLNNYDANATDVVGQTVRTINFTVPTALNNASLYLIVSNHGANTGGEEYNRRQHNISLDNAPVLTYTPGETTCEPYRIYNTQGNGIYGASPRSDAQWQSFSNWCPGSKIPIRKISLGNLSAGSHSFKIEVPTAVFANGEGYFPVSLYLQGDKSQLGTLDAADVSGWDVYPNPAKDFVKIVSKQKIKNYQIYDAAGQKITSEKYTDNKIDLSKLPSGVYLLQVGFENGKVETKKIVKQ